MMQCDRLRNNTTDLLRYSKSEWKAGVHSGGREGSTLSHSDKVGRVSLLRRKTSQLRPKGTRTPVLRRDKACRRLRWRKT